MEFTCYVEFFSPQLSDTPVNGIGVVREDSFINTTVNQNIFNDVLSGSNRVVGCSCLSFESETLSCKYFSKHCNYSRGRYSSTIFINN